MYNNLRFLRFSPPKAGGEKATAVERQAPMETSAPPIIGKENFLAERQFHEVWGLVVLFWIFDFGLKEETCFLGHRGTREISSFYISVLSASSVA
jgi:hypothetical protein